MGSTGWSPNTSHFDWLDSFLAEEDLLSACDIWARHQSLPFDTKHLSVQTILGMWIAGIDRAICEQVNEVLHHDAFQALEARWRGLALLVSSEHALVNCQIRVLDCSWSEVCRDVERASDFDQSVLFHLIYSEEFGTPGGQPFGVILGDYEVAHRPSKNHPHDDVHTLKCLGQIGAASFAPVICGASPELFGVENWSDLTQIMNFPLIFDQVEYTRWRSLRDTEDSRFLGLVLPRILMRRRYTNKYQAFRGMPLREYVDDSAGQDFLWGNGVFAFGMILLREFSEVGWFSHIRGVRRDAPGGGLINRLSADWFEVDQEEVKSKMVTSALISDAVERQLSELGFISICHCFDTSCAAINTTASLQKPRYTQQTVRPQMREFLLHYSKSSVLRELLIILK